MKKIKFYLRFIWIALILTGLMLFFLYPNLFTKESISLFVQRNSSHVHLVYFLLSLLRGIFLLPSTPFVLAGVILFPNQPILVFLVSLFGITITAIYLFYASIFLEFGVLFSNKQLSKSQKITKKLDKHGFWIVLVWSFFPLVPTDLISYIAGSIKMNFTKYITGIVLGESILIGVYIYFGIQIAQ